MTARQRFWKYVTKNPKGCWVWTGCKGTNGYGWFWDGHHQRRAHRYAWQLYHHQPIPDGKIIMHTCDNPACVRPYHLKLGTITDNNRDMGLKGRSALHKYMVGPNGRVLRPQDVRAVKLLLKLGCTGRAIAHCFDVNQATIYTIRRGKSWKHIVAAR